MIRRDIVVIGGSAGSVQPILKLLSRFPCDLHAAIFIVQHTSSNYWIAGDLVHFMAEHTAATVERAEVGPVEMGKVYVCPPNQHLALENGMIRLEQSPKEQHTRPSIDVLFRSAAITYGRRTTGILLSGSLSDGTAGLWQIHARGGLTLVQDPTDAEFPQMPQSAIENIAVDHVLSANALADKLAELLDKNRMAPGLIPETPSILIAEDEPVVASNLQEQLNQLAYRVCNWVKSGEEAILAAAEKNPDLILMDIRLEGKVNGIEAARKIQERLQIPIIFVTAHADLQTLAEAKTTKYYGYLVKPFHSGSIRAAVELALDTREKELRADAEK